MLLSLLVHAISMGSQSLCSFANFEALLTLLGITFVDQFTCFVTLHVIAVIVFPREPLITKVTLKTVAIRLGLMPFHMSSQSVISVKHFGTDMTLEPLEPFVHVLMCRQISA